MRAKALGLTEHPVVVIDHPIASKGTGRIQELAQQSAAEVAQGLMSSTIEGSGG